MRIRDRQKGASAVGLVILVAVVAYGGYVALHYAPQVIEWGIAKTGLETIGDLHRRERFGSTSDVRSAIDKQLYVNQRVDLGPYFTVEENAGGYVVTVRYARELDLLLRQIEINYDKSIILN